MDRDLITKCIRATINLEENLKSPLLDMCLIIEDKGSTNDEKTAAFNTIIEYLSPFLTKSDIDNFI